MDAWMRWAGRGWPVCRNNRKKKAPHFALFVCVIVLGTECMWLHGEGWSGFGLCVCGCVDGRIGRVGG